MPRIRLLAVVAAGALLGLAGCSGESHRTGPDIEPVATRTSAPPKLPTKDQLQAVLPELDAMPTGYAATDPTTKHTRADPAACSAVVGSNDIGKRADSRSTVAYTANGGYGGFYGAGVYAYTSTADTQFAAIKKAVGQCQTFTERDANGDRPVTMTELSFPKLGDGTVAMQSTMDGGITKLILDMAYIRVGRCISYTVSGGVAANPALLEKTTRQVVTKLTKIC